MKKLIFSTVAVLALGAFANAGGKLVAPPEVPPIAIDEWSGPYIGVQAGYLKGEGDVEIKGGYNDIAYNRVYEWWDYDKMTLKPDGFIGGVYIGFNKRFNSDFVLGIEAAANYTKANDTKKITMKKDPMGKFKLKQKNDYALYLKAGTIINDKYMPYILAGATWTKLEGTISTNQGVTLKDSDSISGWTVGAGLEYKINRNVHVRAQYRYSDYKDAKMTMQSGSDVYKVKVKDYNTHSLMLGVSYHF